MRSATVVLAAALTAAINAAPRAIEQSATAVNAVPIALVSARVALDGTSNIHAFTASTTAVRVAKIEIGGTPEGDLFDHLLQPGGLKTFDVVIAAASLSSPKDGIDKNMHKALKVQESPEIRFRLRALEAAGEAYRATGWLTIAGVEREITLHLQVERKGSTLGVTGDTALLMTDFGVTPPKAMLGMLRTNPKVRIRLELVFGASLT